MTRGEDGPGFRWRSIRATNYAQPRLVSGLTRLLDFEDHAVRSLDLVTAATSSLLTFVVLVASALASGT